MKKLFALLPVLLLTLVACNRPDIRTPQGKIDAFLDVSDGAIYESKQFAFSEDIDGIGQLEWVEDSIAPANMPFLVVTMIRWVQFKRDSLRYQAFPIYHTADLQQNSVYPKDWWPLVPFRMHDYRASGDTISLYGNDPNLAGNGARAISVLSYDDNQFEALLWIPYTTEFRRIR